MNGQESVVVTSRRFLSTTAERMVNGRLFESAGGMYDVL
jgi:hypothetical protein